MPEEADEAAEGDEAAESEEDKDDNDGQKTIWDVLSYSSTCSILEYPNGCPDPFGVKKRFDLNPRAKSRFVRWMHGIDWLSFVLFILGTLLLVLTCCIKDRDRDLDDGKKRRIFGFRRSRSKSPSKARENSNGNGDDDASTVNTSESRDQRKKKGFFRRLFSRKR